MGYTPYVGSLCQVTQHSCLLFFDVSGNLFNKTFIHFCFRLKWNIPLYPNALNLMYTDRLELYSQQVTFQGIQYGNMNLVPNWDILRGNRPPQWDLGGKTEGP